MVHNYLEKVGNYSSSNYPIGYFSYIAGGFGKQIDKQLKDISDEVGIAGSGITVSNFIKMIENQTSGNRKYNHNELRQIFGLNRQILLGDISAK